MSKTLQLPPSVAAHHECENLTKLKVGQTSTVTDDLSRNVYGVLGLSLDAIDFPNLLQSLETAVEKGAPFLISTPNVNFLITSQKDEEFRESILQSDMCLVDGMPLIWIAKLLRVPINERVAGSDLFGRLKATAGKSRQLRIFLLGGADGIASAVCKKLNTERSGLQCVGVLNPGFGTIEEMSSAPIIAAINDSQADLLAVFFGAQKAQTWLMQNHHRLRAPVRAQFGATINFEAGTVKRAPQFMRSTGFEWLWRIKEEPYLWRRYWNDGKALLKLLVTCVLPLYIGARRSRGKASNFAIRSSEDPTTVTLGLSGAAVSSNAATAISSFRTALATGKQITVDVSEMHSIDPRFFGLFLMVRKQLVGQGLKLNFTGVSPYTRRMFRLNRFEFLLPTKVIP